MIQYTNYQLRPHSLLIVMLGEHHFLITKSDVPDERIILRFNETELPFP